MRRARVRAALIAVVLLVLTGIGFLIGRTMLAQRRARDATVAAPRDPSVSQSIRKFHRVKVEDGRTVWDLRAEKADFLEAGRVVVDVPEISFFADDGQSVALSGSRGEVVLNGSEVGRIDLRGGIVVEVGPYRLETPEASWIDELNSVVAASGIEIRGGGLELTGNVMILDLGTRRVRVVGEVHTTIKPAEARSGDAAPGEPRSAPSPEEGAGSAGGAHAS